MELNKSMGDGGNGVMERKSAQGFWRGEAILIENEDLDF